MDYQSYHDSSSFERYYRCYSVTSFNKPHLENGDKIVMPASALDQLVFMEIEYPMLFKITNSSANRASHCGVMEFVADEGTVLLPSWMMKNLLLEEGDLLSITTASLPKASYIKLQPHEMKFVDEISNPKAVLEKSLRLFSCLTVGDTITVSYNGCTFNIDVVEAKPKPAVSIIETDCEVDFAPAIDYKEPEKAPLPVVEKAPPCCQEQEVPKLVAFTGVSRRLDGLVSTVIPLPQPKPKEQQQPASSSVSRKRAGILVFGSSSSSSQASKKEEENVANGVKSEVESGKDEKPKFQAFTGKKYTLG